MYYAGVVSGGLRDNRKHEVFGQQKALSLARGRKLSATARRNNFEEAKKKACELYHAFFAKHPHATKGTAYRQVAQDLDKTTRTIRLYVTGK